MYLVVLIQGPVHYIHVANYIIYTLKHFNGMPMSDAMNSTYVGNIKICGWKNNDMLKKSDSNTCYGSVDLKYIYNYSFI